MITTKLEAIQSLVPSPKLVMKDDEIIKWFSSETQPTEEEITAEQTRLDAVYTNNEYQRQRAAEYPSVVDQLDKMFHSGFQAWKDEIQKDKEKYPKP